jgi:HAD superfamily 5'-nucleotidase-like hydrolase
MQLSLALPELIVPIEGHAPPAPNDRIYCNRSLRLDQIEAVGFDMDYTLAIYHQEEMDRQSILATLPKLLERGYPKALREMQCRFDFPIRGLLIDRKLGNVLKMDRYRYVKKAYHGLRELTVEERRGAYHTKRLRPAMRRFHFVDTLYALSEVSMFAAAVEALEAAGEPVDYTRLFDDIRTCIDLSHQDGSILGPVLADLPRFVARDPLLGPMLHKLRSAGKRLFLLTNSQPEYTDRMMSYLLADAMPQYPSWRSYFDVVVTAACKPRFFTGDAPFEEVVNGERRPASNGKLERGRVYAGGNINAFHEALEVAGDHVLYVGDHIYGDVLRAKKEGAWRTAMIIQEMDHELSVIRGHQAELAQLGALESQRVPLLDLIREHQARLKAIQRRLEDDVAVDARLELEANKLRERRAIERYKARLRAMEVEAEALERDLHERFHPFWGPLFKAGTELSSFGDQVEEFACLYTARASNLSYYSPMHYFQSPRDWMPHELHGGA